MTQARKLLYKKKEEVLEKNRTYELFYPLSLKKLVWFWWIYIYISCKVQGLWYNWMLKARLMVKMLHLNLWDRLYRDIYTYSQNQYNDVAYDILDWWLHQSNMKNVFLNDYLSIKV